MLSLPLVSSSTITSINNHHKHHHQQNLFTSSVSRVSSLPRSGVCSVSQEAELLPTASPDIVVREARLEDYWEIVETHCSVFYPRFSFHLGVLLRIYRMIGILAGFLLPRGCKRTFLVAVVDSSVYRTLCDGLFSTKFSLNREFVAGILTVDTLADFLPRKGLLQERRTGIAYISNVAVREKFRRQGVAKRLVAQAEAQASSWGCRAIALHCDPDNAGATELYRNQGFKCIRVPEGAKWPQPRSSLQYNFMMKLLNKSGVA